MVPPFSGATAQWAGISLYVDNSEKVFFGTANTNNFLCISQPGTPVIETFATPNVVASTSAAVEVTYNPMTGYVVLSISGMSTATTTIEPNVGCLLSLPSLTPCNPVHFNAFGCTLFIVFVQAHLVG